MGLRKFEPQGSLFESLGSIAPQLFDHQDRYKLFALKIWPLLSGCREELAQCYDQGNGRTGVEPVVLLGVSSERRPLHLLQSSVRACLYARIRSSAVNRVA